MADMLTVTVGTTDYTFDWIAQHIQIESGVTEVTAADLKTAIKDAEDDVVAMPFPPIAKFFNPVTLTGTASTFLNVVLQDQWRVESFSNSGTLTVGNGNVVNVNNGIDIFVANPLVNMVNNTSAAGVLVQGTGSGLSAAEQTRLIEIHRRLALDAANALTNKTDGGIEATGIDITAVEQPNGDIVQTRQ